MTAQKKKINPSARRKLIPATGMLLASAMALTSATYAWFTMSREVEVTNISMVATTPEDIQISLGKIGSGKNEPVTTGDSYSLAANTGVLYAGSTGDANNGKVVAPDSAWDWADTADFSHYYQIGKLIPASSNDGSHIFFTAQANGAGKTVKDGAMYYQADDGVNTLSGASMTNMDSVGKSGTGYAKATLHAVQGDNDKWASTSGASTAAGYTSGADGYQKSTNWNDTHDDGYYVDIPVWFRTSSTEETKLTVKGYVAPRTWGKNANSNDEALYKAVRVAILNPGSGKQDLSGTAPNSGTTGLINLHDGMGGSMTSGSSGTLSTAPFGEDTILNWYSGTNNSGAVYQSGAGLINGQSSGTSYANRYKAASLYPETNTTSFVTLDPGTGGGYGKATKVIVRVWLEGNDPDCWNDTAGQDWYINLKFGRTTDMDNANITGAYANDGNNVTNTSGTIKYGDGKTHGNT